MAKATRSDLEQWQAWEDEIVQLRAKANALSKQQAALEKEKLLPHVQAEGGKARCCVIGSWRLLLKEKRASVQWKPEFLKVFARLAEHLGLKQSPEEAAKEIAGQQPTEDVLAIEKL